MTTYSGFWTESSHANKVESLDFIGSYAHYFSNLDKFLSIS